MGDQTDRTGKTSNPSTDEKDVRLASFRKETATENTQEHQERDDRSTLNRPIDPNALTADVKFPPGLKPEDAIDPGRATPGAAPVDNRSGKREK